MSAIKTSADKKIRVLWLEEEDWCFSAVGVIEALTDTANPQVHWRVLKKRLKEEGNETVTNCNALKLEAKAVSSANASDKKRLATKSDED